MNTNTTNLSAELGELLVFISKVATAIRMNSPYNSKYNHTISVLLEKNTKTHFFSRSNDNSKTPIREIEQYGHDVQVLSDLLQQLGQLGASIQSHNYEHIIHATEYISGLLSKPHFANAVTFERWDNIFDIGEGVFILRNIRDKVNRD